MNFTLRPWTNEDISSLLENANDPEIARYMTDGFPYPYKQENAEAFIAFANKDFPIRIFAIEVGSRAVGGIGIHPQSDIMRKNAEMGYWLGRRYHRKGIISKAIPQVVEFAFATYDITRIYARPFGNNIASQKALEKAGFILEARIKDGVYKNGEYLDELIYAIRR